MYPSFPPLSNTNGFLGFVLKILAFSCIAFEELVLPKFMIFLSTLPLEVWFDGVSGRDIEGGGKGTGEFTERKCEMG